TDTREAGGTTNREEMEVTRGHTAVHRVHWAVAGCSDAFQGHATMTERSGAASVDIEAALLTVYRLYSVGDEIGLDVAERWLAQSTSRAALSGARQSESIQIARPPLRADLDRLAGTLGSFYLEGLLRASVYDLGVVVLAWRSPIMTTTWGEVA